VVGPAYDPAQPARQWIAGPEKVWSRSTGCAPSPPLPEVAVQDTGSSSPLDSRTLGKVIDSMKRRLGTVPPDDPAARLLRECLDDITEQRDHIAERENADRCKTNMAALAADCVLLVIGIVFAGAGVYMLATPGHSVSAGAWVLGCGLVLALISIVLGLVRMPEILEYRANRAVRRS
jgi:hypothetical protein